MHPKLIPATYRRLDGFVDRPIALDAQSFALLLTVDQYLTPEDWADAAGAGRAPAILDPGAGRIFARKPGPEAPAARWHSLTPAEAAGDPWPSAIVPMSSGASGRLSVGAGEDCERVLEWCTERDLRVPPPGWSPGEPIRAWRRHVLLPAPSHTDLMVTPESIPDLDPADAEPVQAAVGEDLAPRPSPLPERVRLLMHEPDPTLTTQVKYTWRHPVVLLGYALLVGLGLALLAGTCG